MLGFTFQSETFSGENKNQVEFNSIEMSIVCFTPRIFKKISNNQQERKKLAII